MIAGVLQTPNIKKERIYTMETSVLIQAPYKLEDAYSPLEERTDIDYAVMSVDNFNVGDSLIGLYITISSDPIGSVIMSGMIWDVVKKIIYEVLSRLVQSLGKIFSQKCTQEECEQETSIKISLCIKESPKKEYRMYETCTINRPLSDDNMNKISENMMNQLKEIARTQYEKDE